MADRAAQRLSLLPMSQENFRKEAAGAGAEDEQATPGAWGNCAVHSLASSPLVPC